MIENCEIFGNNNEIIGDEQGTATATIRRSMIHDGNLMSRDMANRMFSDYPEV